MNDFPRKLIVFFYFCISLGASALLLFNIFVFLVRGLSFNIPKYDQITVAIYVVSVLVTTYYLFSQLKFRLKSLGFNSLLAISMLSKNTVNIVMRLWSLVATAAFAYFWYRYFDTLKPIRFTNPEDWAQIILNTSIVPFCILAAIHLLVWALKAKQE